jgi:hypothetical protein
MDLEQCLHESATSHLRAVAAFRKIDMGANPARSDVIAVVRDRLLESIPNDAVMRDLNDGEKEILLQVRDAGGSIPVSELEKSWGSDDPDVARRWFWHKSVSRGLARLRLTGLLYCLRGQNEKNGVYVLPEEFYRLLNLSAVDLSDYQYAPYQFATARMIILSDMYYLLQYMNEYNVRKLRNGGLAKRHKPLIIKKLNALTPATLPRDEPYVTMLFSIACELGFISHHGLKIIIDPKVTTWFGKSQIEQVHDLYRAWLKRDIYGDLNGFSTVVITTAGLRHPFSRVKRAVTGVLSVLPQNQWIPMETLSGYFRRHRPYFYRPDHSPDLWQIKHAATKENIPPGAVWDNLEKNLIEQLITQSLAWFGLVDIGLSTDGRFEAFMINRLGSAIMSGKPELTLNDHQHESASVSQMNTIVIQPDFEVLASAGMVLSIRDKLEKIAECISGGHLQKYRITRNRVARALENGFDGKSILAFLDSVSRTNLPQNVKTSIQDWIDEFGKVEITRAVIMRTENPYLLQEVLANPGISGVIDQQIGPETATVSAGDLDHLITELKRMGHLPKVNIDTHGSAPISLKMDRATAGFLLHLLNDTLSRGSSDQQENLMLAKLLERLTQHLSE